MNTRDRYGRRLTAVPPQLSRRTFLRGTGFGLTGVGAALLLGCGGDGEAGASPGTPTEEPPPEVTTIKIAKDHSLCLAPQYVAKEFLEQEGFTNVEYKLLPLHSAKNPMIALGEVNMSLNFAAPITRSLDKGTGIVALAGAHVGCYEIFARDGINSIAELEGKTVLVSSTEPNDAEYEFMSSILRFIGVSPDLTLDWAQRSATYKLLDDGRVDAVLAIPPTSQEFRTLGIGHSIFNSMQDPPFSQYYCCLVTVGREFLETNPVATKRALRAFLKGVDKCAQDPAYVAQYLVDWNFTSNYAYALEAMQQVRYGHWRDWDPENTVRFYALRLNEAKVIKSTPEEIIKKGTDWRFLNEVRQEMAYFPPADPTRSAFALDCAIEGPKEG